MKKIQRLVVFVMIMSIVVTVSGCGPTIETLSEMKNDAPVFEEGAKAYLKDQFGDKAELISIAPVTQEASPCETNWFRVYYYGNAEGTFLYDGVEYTIYGYMGSNEKSPSFWDSLSDTASETNPQ